MSRRVAGAWAGTVAGIVMAAAMMGVMVVTGRSPWTNPNLIAAMWMGADVANGALGLPTLVGFVTHQATSALMGVLAVPFIKQLVPARTVLVAVAYSVASYPLVFGLVLTWANPTMVQRTSLPTMTLAHILFGVVLAVVYRRLRLRSVAERLSVPSYKWTPGE